MPPRPVKHLTEQELAERLGITVQAVKRWRQQDRGPAYIKGEGRMGTVRYPLAEVEAWEQRQLVRTSA